MPPGIRVVLFFALSTAIAVAAHVYLYRRLVRDVTERRELRRLGLIVIVLLGVAGGVARPLARFLPQDSLRPLMLALLIWLGMVLHLLMLLIAFDLARWLHARWIRWRRPAEEATGADPRRRQVLAAGISLASTAIAGGLTAYGTWRAFAAPESFEVPVRLPGLPKTLEGLRVAHLTDVHVGGVIQERFIQELVRRTLATRPDLIVLTGDLVDGTPAQLGRYVAPLAGLRARFGTWFVTGNHDYYSGAGAWVAALGGLGIPSLRNRRVEIGDGGGTFDLAGVDDWAFEYDLEAALEGRDSARGSVLLCHQPANEEAVAARQVGLMLSGHTHGGQIFPGTLIADLIWGDRSTGLSRLGGSQFWVSRGCGFVGPPMRVGAAPELPVLVLLPA